jgi:hypothetical protein
MSLLSSLTSILELIKFPGLGDSREEYRATKPDDCTDGKQSKWNEDHKGRDDYSKNGDKDDYSKLSGKDEYSKHVKDDYSKHDDGWNDAKNDNCQPQQHYCDPKPSDDCGKGNTYLSSGEALAKLDLSLGDFGSHGPDHSGDMLGALASMSSDDALEYAIGQLGPADHSDVGHVDVAADTSHDTDA